MRKKSETLHQALLEHARVLVEQEGPQALSIRRLAALAGIAPGTIYHYFRDKEEILLSLLELHWSTTLAELEATLPPGGILQQLSWIHDFLRHRISHSLGWLMLALGEAAPGGQRQMAQSQQLLRALVLRCLCQSADICADAWTATFSPAVYADFLLAQLLLLLKNPAGTPDFLLELVKRTLCQRDG